jgi:hypothetical protein
MAASYLLRSIPPCMTVPKEDQRHDPLFNGKQHEDPKRIFIEPL